MIRRMCGLEPVKWRFIPVCNSECLASGHSIRQLRHDHKGAGPTELQLTDHACATPKMLKLWIFGPGIQLLHMVLMFLIRGSLCTPKKPSFQSSLETKALKTIIVGDGVAEYQKYGPQNDNELRWCCPHGQKSDYNQDKLTTTHVTWQGLVSQCCLT